MKSIGRDINSMSRDELINLIELQAVKMANQLQWMLKRDARIDELAESLDGVVELAELYGLHDRPEYQRARAALKKELK